MNNEIVKIESKKNYSEIVNSVMWIVIILTIVSALMIRMAILKDDELDEKRDKLDYGTEEYEKTWEKHDFYMFVYNLSWGTTIGFGCITVMIIKFYYETKKMHIVVTDKRVYGVTKFGKQVDLPLDSISAIVKTWFKGISVSTSSGRIKFLLISNNEEIFKTISDLLIERQDKKDSVVNQSAANNIEELKQYKELLDSGVITEEEFNAKKKQILNI